MATTTTMTEALNKYVYIYVPIFIKTKKIICGLQQFVFVLDSLSAHLERFRFGFSTPVTGSTLVCFLTTSESSGNRFSIGVKSSSLVSPVNMKLRQKAGWIQRTFSCKHGWFLRHMWNSLTQPHLDYCSQLWATCGGNSKKHRKHSQRLHRKNTRGEASELLEKITSHENELTTENNKKT